MQAGLAGKQPKHAAPSNNDMMGSAAGSSGRRSYHSAAVPLWHQHQHQQAPLLSSGSGSGYTPFHVFDNSSGSRGRDDVPTGPGVYAMRILFGVGVATDSARARLASSMAGVLPPGAAAAAAGAVSAGGDAVRLGSSSTGQVLYRLLRAVCKRV